MQQSAVLSISLKYYNILPYTARELHLCKLQDSLLSKGGVRCAPDTFFVLAAGLLVY